MRKIALLLMSATMLLAFQPYQSSAATVTTPITADAPKPAESAEAKTLTLRLDEINAMDKSNLSSSEKKSLRKEVRSIKKQLSELGDGLYLSVGAIIIIILLLIILL